jgi:hypothetical protein
LVVFLLKNLWNQNVVFCIVDFYANRSKVVNYHSSYWNTQTDM